MRSLYFSLVALGLTASSALSADLTVSVRTPGGQPVKDAVVTLHYAGGDAAPLKIGGPYAVAQHNIQFEPFVTVVPMGADVAFPNKDKVRHHVYSFSPTKRFELKLYGNEEARTVHFDKAGVVALGCNIHDQMVGFIDVVDTPYAAKTGENGDAVIAGAPGGNVTLTVWRPYLKAPKNEISRGVVLPRQGAAHEIAVIDVRPPPGGAMSMPMR